MFKSLISWYIKDQIKQKAVDSLGIDASTFDSVAGDALDSIIMWVAKNTETEEGKAWFVEALKKDHDGSMLDDVMWLINQEDKGSNILDHILGSKKSEIEAKVAESSGVDTEKATSMFNTIALIFMQMMWKQANGGSLDLESIAGLLQQEKKEVATNSTNPMIAMFLDTDGDGDVDGSDLMWMASKLLN